MKTDIVTLGVIFKISIYKLS